MTLTGNPTNTGAISSIDAIETKIDEVKVDLGDSSARTNLTTTIAMLGNPDAAGKTIYDNLGDFVARTNDGSLLDVLGVPDVAGKDLHTLLVTDRLDHATYGLSALQVQVDDIQDKIDGTDATANTLRREYGKKQIMEFSVTAAANAGSTLVATVTTQPVLITRCTIHADAAQTGDMTSCALEGGASQVIELIAVGVADQASLDAENKQVSASGQWRFPATSTIAIDLLGSGATAVDLTVTIEYEACVDGGYLA